MRKDVQFNTHVTGADYGLVSGKWRVATEDGQIATYRFLIIAAGFAAKRHFPDWKGAGLFQERDLPLLILATGGV
jgi:cation diffusion facilitator CzcD-associated flavoprotein CzcO